MNIVIVTNNYYPTMGGISTYVNDLYNEFEKSNDDYLYFPERINGFEILGKIKFVLKTTIKILINRKKKGEPLFISTHSANYCLIIGLLCKIFINAKVIHTYHTPITKLNKSFYFIKYADAIVYVSKATQKLYKGFGVKKHFNEVIIPGGIDTNKYLPGLNKSKHQLKILFVGRICKEKGIIELIKSIKILQNLDIEVDIVGNTQNDEQDKYYKQAEILVSQMQINGKIKFSGKVVGEKLISKYKNSDLFVCPSIWPEPAPMVIAEALSCGLPVIAFNVGGLAERIKDGNDGILVKPEDIGAFAESIQKLYENRKLLNSMSESARKNALNEHDKKHMAEKYINLFRKLNAR